MKAAASSPSFPFVVLVSLSFFVALGSAPAHAQGLRVNAPLVPAPDFSGEDVVEFVVAPGGTRVAFLADPEHDGRLELFSAPVAEAGAWVRLSTPGEGCHGLHIAAGRVVYLETAPVGPDALCSVPLGGGAAPVRLNPAVHVFGYEVSAPARRVVFGAEQPNSSTLELWSAPLHGGAPAVRLDAPVVAGGEVRRFRLSPDGRTVLFTADRVTAGVIELWAAPADGSHAPVRLSGPMVAGGDVREHFAASGARAIFTADAAAVDVIELWSAPLDGGAPPVRLNGALVAGGDVGWGTSWREPFRIGADGATVVYAADQETDGVHRLYGVPSAGGDEVLLGGGRPLDGVSEFEIAPDGTRVVYGADDRVLYGAPLDGGPGASLSAPGWRPPFFAFARAPDGTRVVYRSFETAGGLWSIPADGSRARQRLDGTSAPTGEVRSFRVAGPRVLYTADEVHDEQYELFSAPAAGDAPRVRLGGALPGFADVLDFAGTPGGLRALYLADGRFDETFALWSVPTTGTGTPIELAMPLGPSPAFDDVREFAWSGDGERLLYGTPERFEPRNAPVGVYSASMGALGAEGRFPVVHLGTGWGIVASPHGERCAFAWAPPCESWPCFDTQLRTAPTDGSAPATTVASGLLWIREARFDEGATHLACVNEGWLPSPAALYLVAADGSAPPSFLGSNPGPFEFSADGQYLVYVVRDVSERVHLCSVPVDLSGPPLALEPPFSDPQQSVRALRLTGDGRAVFLADPLVVGAYELWIAPLDGSAPAVRIGPPGDPLAVLQPDFRITADDAYAVYVLDREVWSVPLDPARGYVAVRLSAKSTPGSGVIAPLDGRSQFELAPDGSRVAYLAGVDADGVRELWSVPLDGGKPPVRLHGALDYDRGVEPSGFEISADSRWVVFAADLVGDRIRSLYCAPLSGSLAPLELSGPFVAGGELRLNPPGGIRAAFEISADAESVVYLADQDEDERVELYSVRLDGSRPPRRLNRRLPLGGDVQSFALQPGGAWVAYLADQEADDEFELFVSALDVDHRLPSAPPRPLR